MLVLLDILQALEGHFIRGEVADIFAFEKDAPFVLLQKSGNGPEKGRFARAVPADNDDHFTRADLKRNIEHHMQFLVRDIEVLDRQDPCHWLP